MYDDDQDALAAEYVLGTLSADEREHAEALLTLDPGFAASVRMWERRLGELNVMVEAVEPPPELWDKIKAELGAVEPASEALPPAPVLAVARAVGRNAAGNTSRRIAAADHGGRAGHGLDPPYRRRSVSFRKRCRIRLPRRSPNAWPSRRRSAPSA